MDQSQSTGQENGGVPNDAQNDTAVSKLVIGNESNSPLETQNDSASESYLADNTKVHLSSAEGCCEVSRTDSLSDDQAELPPPVNISSVPTPESIPLPDTSPPPLASIDNDSDSCEDEHLHGYGPMMPVTAPQAQHEMERTFSHSAKKSEEYDPSNPLNSSDEEDEHSTSVISHLATQISPQKRLTEESSSDVDLSSIPMPSDDYRRPTIQFSIPTRHKLVSISSLVKRQRGVVKKTSSSAGFNFSSELSKAFGEDNKSASDDETQSGNEGKVSLVAEIFGSDEEEEIADDENVESTGDSADVSSGTSKVATVSSIPTYVVPFEKGNDDEILSDQLSESVRWKKATDQDSGNSIEQSQNPDVAAPSKDDPDACIIVHENIQRRKSEDDDIQILSISRVNKGVKRPLSNRKGNSLLESVSEGDSEFGHESPNNSKSRESKHKLSKDEDDLSVDSEKPQQKRNRLSSPLSRDDINREEGELDDSPEKRRKKRKDKKSSKKKSKAKDDKSYNFEEKLPGGVQKYTRNSSEDEAQEAISWRKPSNSTKERNYRDGKPKPEEKYFKASQKKKDDLHSNRVEANNQDSSTIDSSVKDSGYDKRRGRRRSLNRRSRSASPARSRLNNKRISSRHRSGSSQKSPYSRSRSRSPRRHQRRRRHSATSRSSSRDSSRVAPRTPLGSRNGRRSSSFSYSKTRRRRRRSESTSSVNSLRGRRRHREKQSDRERDRSRRRKKVRNREKVPEVKEAREKDSKEKDRKKYKDKKRHKKRREKSLSPAKAIYADGDSIVVSLNFQKSTSSKSDNPNNRSEIEDDNKKTRLKSRHNRACESSEVEKPRLQAKTLLVDLETSTVREQRRGSSPSGASLSDGKESNTVHKMVSLADTDEKGNPGCPLPPIGLQDSTEVGMSYTVDADSTQQHNSDQPDAEVSTPLKQPRRNSVSPSGSSNLSPSRLDAEVSSTKNAEKGSRHSSDFDSSMRSPHCKNGIDNDMHEPHSPAESPPPVPSDGTHLTHMLDNASEAVSVSDAGTRSGPPTSTSGKPLIGTIPGLMPSSITTTGNLGATGVPPPIIPPPPVPQVRFPLMNQNLLTSNALASIALYAPIMAARQQNQATLPNPSKFPTSLSSLNSARSGSSNNVLLPTSQIVYGGQARSKSNTSKPGVDGGDSPFSPNSSDGDDLFEPPAERNSSDSATPNKTDKSSANNDQGAAKQRPKGNLFDSLFGGATTPKKGSPQKSIPKGLKVKPSSSHHKSSSKKGKKEIVKLTEGELRSTEDVPNSAVELRVKEKFLMKLNRQDRVVEEVKLSLKPHYNKKHITKDEYKEILRRAVPKICHSKSGEINPSKIKELVEAYIKKFRQLRKKQK